MDGVRGAMRMRLSRRVAVLQPVAFPPERYSMSKSLKNFRAG